MLKGIFELTTTCGHLSSQGKQPDLCCSETVIHPKKIAIVAFGNPLVEDDSAAIALIRLIQQTEILNKYCLFNFDSGFAWLKEVLLRHDIVVIVDSILDSTKIAPDGWFTIPLTESVLEHSGFVIRATHGLSWLDEIKMMEPRQTGNLFFFGIDGPEFKAHNENERDTFLKRGLQGLTELLETCSLQNKGGNFDA
ncbi:MAG: hypothetical protein SGJ27_24450 [Candidatus Melainabacteria bacterium]|nr:hypothetical protein [Candidatus Melainabacteria bacterium]